MTANNLKSDITYQREQNEKLRHNLTQLENEKDRLVSEVNTQGNIVDRCKEDADMHHLKLRKAEEELRRLQDTHNTSVRELKAMVERAEGLIRKEREGETDKQSLKITLDELVKERNDLIFRMNNLTEKYELYVKEMTREREETIRSNKNRTKLLTASTLFTQLTKRKNQRLSIAMERIKRMAGYHQCLIKCAAELALWKDEYKNKLMGLAFRRWWHNGLSWVKERGINEVLLQREHNRKQRAMLFSQWQRAFRELSGRRDMQFEAAQRTVELRAIQQEKNLRRAFDRWLRYSMLQSRRDNLMRKILLNLKRKREADAFLQWMAATRQRKERLKAENLANEVAIEQFKRQMFSRFRHNLYLQEDSKVADMQVNLEGKNMGKHKGRFIKACTILFMRLNKNKRQQALEEGFQSMKFNALAEKKARTEGELNKEIPEVELLEKTLKTEIEEHNAKRRHDILEAALLTFRRRLHYFFERWRNIIPLDLKNAETLKKIFNHFGANKLVNAFNRWRFNAHKCKLEEKQRDITSCNDNIVNLDEAIRELGTKIANQRNHWQTYSLSKLQRIAHIITRRFLHNRILQWRDSVIALRNIEKGGRRLARTMRRHKLLTAFNKYREGKRRHKEEEGFKNKIKTVHILNERNNKKRIFRKFRLLVKLIKAIKNMLRKLFRDKDKDKLRRVLTKWRKSAHNITRETAQQENEEKEERNEKIMKDIEDNEIREKRTKEDIKDLTKARDKQGTIVIAKSLFIWQNRRLFAAFKTWRDNTKRSNALRTLLVRYVHKREHNNYRAALDCWRTGAYTSHIKTINDELKVRIGKHSTFTKLSALKLGETAEELKELKEVYTQIKDQHDTDEKKIAISTKILDKLQRFYIKFPHDHNYFLAWVDMIHREKALQGRAKIITQTYVGKHIYAKLKQAALQNMAKEKTEKKWARALRILYKCWLRKGFKGMKEGKSTLSEQQKKERIQNREDILADTNDYLEMIKERSCITHEKEILRRRLQRAFWAWQRQSVFQRLLKKKSELLNDSIRFIRLSGSFGRWREDVNFISNDAEKEKKASKYYDDLALKKAFKGWHKEYIRNVTLPKVLARLAKRQLVNNIGHAFEQLNIDLKDQYQNDNKNKTIASLRLGNLLINALTTTLSEALSRIMNTTQSRVLNNEMLRRVFLKLLRRKLEESFNRWRHKEEEYKLIDDLGRQGQTAIDSSVMSRKHSSFKKLLQDGNLEGVHKRASLLKLHPTSALEQGVDKKDSYKGKSGYLSPGFMPTDSLILDKGRPEDRKSGLSFDNEEMKVSWSNKRCERLEGKDRAIRKLILQWLQRTKGKDVIGKYLYFWRRWLRIKRNVEISTDLILRRLYGGEKAWAFDKLRNIQRAGIKTFEKAPRKALINT